MEEKNVKKKNIKLLIIIILAIIFISGIGTSIYFLFFAPTEIDLTKYLTIDYDGYSGYGSAIVTIDEDSLGEYLKDSSLASKLAEKAVLEIENSENLSNGDNLKIKVTISSSWLEKNKLKLKDKTLKTKVDNLDETKSIDLFKDLEVEITGISPEIEISVNNNNSDKFIRKITYSVDKRAHLKNGDTVTITANYNKSDALEAGVTPEADTMEYTVKGKPTYISSLDDINDSVTTSIKDLLLTCVKEEIKTHGNDTILYGYEGITYDETFTNTEPELVNSYFLTPKTSTNYSSTLNSIYGIYKVTFTSDKTGKTYDWYYTAHVDNLAIKSKKLYEEKENKCTVSSYYNDEYSLTLEDAYEHYIDSQKTSFVIEEIK